MWNYGRHKNPCDEEILAKKGRAFFIKPSTALLDFRNSVQVALRNQRLVLATVLGIDF